jgi:raffinose/stachyose/melibiose transport system permease protein
VFVAIYNPQYGIINEALRFVGLGSLATEWLFNPSTAMNAVCAIEIWQWSGFHMVIYLAALRSIPLEFMEAAVVDGATKLQRIIKIKLPMISEAIVTNLVLAIIGGMRVFDKVYATTNGGPVNATEVFSTYIYKTFAQGLYGVSSAYNLIFTGIIMLLSIIVLRAFKKGWNA